jgi:hypothetical protein
METLDDGRGTVTVAATEPTCRYFRVKRRDIVFLKFILEAYEGMNVMSTVDNGAGIIRILIMPGFEQEMEGVLDDLGSQVIMEEVEWEGEGAF